MKTKPATPDVTSVSDETWDRAVWECAIRKRRICVLDVIRAAMCLQRHGEYRKNHRLGLSGFVIGLLTADALVALARSPLRKAGVDAWVSPGVIPLTLRMVAAALEGHGFFAPYTSASGSFAYRSKSGRIGTLNLHDRDGGRFRFVIDSNIPDPDGIGFIHPTQPETYKGPPNAHEFTCMIAEFPQIIPWLVRWIVAYDCGAPLPLMPEGREYPGGYRWTRAVQVHMGVDHG